MADKNYSVFGNKSQFSSVILSYTFLDIPELDLIIQIENIHVDWEVRIKWYLTFLMIISKYNHSKILHK